MAHGTIKWFDNKKDSALSHRTKGGRTFSSTFPSSAATVLKPSMKVIASSLK